MKLNLIMVLLIFMSLVSCGKDSTEEAGPVTLSPGKYFVESVSSNTATGYLTKLEGNTVTFLKVTYPDKYNTANAYYSYSKGTYEMDGDKMIITYSEELCDKVGSETLIVRQMSDAISIEKNNVVTRFTSEEAYSPRYITNNFSVMVKDTNCIY